MIRDDKQYRDECVALYDSHYEELTIPARDFHDRICAAYESTQDIPDSLVEEFRGFRPILRIWAWTLCTQYSPGRLAMARKVHDKLCNLVFELFGLDQAGLPAGKALSEEDRMIIDAMHFSDKWLEV